MLQAADEGLKSCWVNEVALPFLLETPLFAGCPESFLQLLAAPLSEQHYAPGQLLFSAGEASSSMLILLEGLVEMESKTGTKIGLLGEGGVLGEAQALGLFKARSLTARALQPCRVIAVTAEALQRVMRTPEGEVMQKGSDKLLDQRKEQVDRGLPLSVLTTKTSVNDVAARLVSSQAERLDFSSGAYWEMLPDSDPNGPRLGIITHGKAVVEISDDRREDVVLRAPYVLAEGLLAESGARVSGARIRIVSADCEVYRIRLFDLLAAAYSGPQVPDWFYHLRLLEREARGRIESRITCSRALAQSRAPRREDAEIREWKQRRDKSMKRAEKIRQEKAQDLGRHVKLPAVLQSASETELRSWPKSSKLAPSPLPSLINVSHRGLAAYPAARKFMKEAHVQYPQVLAL